MPLLKREVKVESKPQDSQTPTQTDDGNFQGAPSVRVGGTRVVGDRPKHFSKEEYWDRKEERDVRRDKDMAWSGLAQAAIASPYVAQFNVENTEDGLVALVVRITDKLLKARDEHNGR